MASDHDSFLRAIISSPHDDLPRLVYADWLDERGDARGRFIRAECEWDSLSTTTGSREQNRRNKTKLHQLQQECQLLIARHGKHWARPLLPFTSSHVFRRGFVNYVQMTAAQCRDHVARVMDLTPLLELDVIQGNAEQGLAAVAVLERLMVWERLDELLICVDGLSQDQAIGLADRELCYRVPSVRLGLSNVPLGTRELLTERFGGTVQVFGEVFDDQAAEGDD